MPIAEQVAEYVEAAAEDVTAEQVNEALGIGNSRIYLNRLVKKGQIARVARGRYTSVSTDTGALVSSVSRAASHPQVRAGIRPVASEEFPALGPATATSLSRTLQRIAKRLEKYLDGEEPYRVDAKGAYSPNPAYTILLGYLAEVRQLMVAVHKMGIAERETAVLEFDALSGFPEFVAWLLETLKPHPEALRDVLVAMSDKGWAGGSDGA